MNPTRLHVLFSGRVQGVGFRYTTVSVASRLPGITGWVRNLDDGRVEIMAEGERAALESFLAGVRREMEDCIRKTDAGWSAGTGEFSGFRVTG